MRNPQLFRLTHKQTNELRGLKKEIGDNFNNSSNQVPPLGIEPKFQV